MNYLVGFRASCEFMAIILIVFSLIFYIFTRDYVTRSRGSMNIKRNDINSLDALEGGVNSNRIDDLKSAEDMIE